MVDKSVSVEGVEENSNDTKIMEPPASFRSGVWKHYLINGVWLPS